MVNKNTLGIIFPNTYDDLIPELVHRRTMASVPFGGRYRMIDFTLSAMVNAGIDNVTVLAKKNYYSLMDHLGNGREWDLSRKLGGLNMVPPFAQSNTKMYHGRVEAIASNAIRALAEYVAIQVTKMVLFLLCFVLILAGWFVLSHALDLAFKLPVLSTLNQWSGAAIGLVKGGVLLFIACWLFRGLLPQEAIDQSVLLRFFCTTNPFSLLSSIF